MSQTRYTQLHNESRKSSQVSVKEKLDYVIQFLALTSVKDNYERAIRWVVGNRSEAIQFAKVEKGACSFGGQKGYFTASPGEDLNITILKKADGVQEVSNISITIPPIAATKSMNTNIEFPSGEKLQIKIKAYSMGTGHHFDDQHSQVSKATRDTELSGHIPPSQATHPVTPLGRKRSEIEGGFGEGLKRAQSSYYGDKSKSNNPLDNKDIDYRKVYHEFIRRKYKEITESEFIELVKDVHKDKPNLKISDDDYEKMFECMDLDNNGYITTNEIARLAIRYGKKEENYKICFTYFLPDSEKETIKDIKEKRLTSQDLYDILDDIMMAFSHRSQASRNAYVESLRKRILEEYGADENHVKVEKKEEEGEEDGLTRQHSLTKKDMEKMKQAGDTHQKTKDDKKSKLKDEKYLYFDGFKKALDDNHPEINQIYVYWEHLIIYRKVRDKRLIFMKIPLPLFLANMLPNDWVEEYEIVHAKKERNCCMCPCISCPERVYSKMEWCFDPPEATDADTVSDVGVEHRPKTK